MVSGPDAHDEFPYCEFDSVNVPPRQWLSARPTCPAPITDIGFVAHSWQHVAERSPAPHDAA